MITAWWSSIWLFCLHRPVKRRAVGADPSQDFIVALIVRLQARPHLSLCVFVQGKESERGMRTKCHDRERAGYFSSHAPVGQTKSNIAIGQQQHSHRVKAWKNQSKQHSAPPLTLGQSLIVLCRIRGSFQQMLFMPQSCSPPLGRPSILLLRIYCIRNKNKHSLCLKPITATKTW